MTSVFRPSGRYLEPNHARSIVERTVIHQAFSASEANRHDPTLHSEPATDVIGGDPVWLHAPAREIDQARGSAPVGVALDGAVRDCHAQNPFSESPNLPTPLHAPHAAVDDCPRLLPKAPGPKHEHPYYSHRPKEEASAVDAAVGRRSPASWWRQGPMNVRLLLCIAIKFGVVHHSIVCEDGLAEACAASGGGGTWRVLNGEIALRYGTAGGGSG